MNTEKLPSDKTCFECVGTWTDRPFVPHTTLLRATCIYATRCFWTFNFETAEKPVSAATCAYVENFTGYAAIIRRTELLLQKIRISLRWWVRLFCSSRFELKAFPDTLRSRSSRVDQTSSHLKSKHRVFRLVTEQSQGFRPLCKGVGPPKPTIIGLLHSKTRRYIFRNVQIPQFSYGSHQKPQQFIFRSENTPTIHSTRYDYSANTGSNQKHTPSGRRSVEGRAARTSLSHFAASSLASSPQVATVNK